MIFNKYSILFGAQFYRENPLAENLLYYIVLCSKYIAPLDLKLAPPPCKLHVTPQGNHQTKQMKKKNGNNAFRNTLNSIYIYIVYLSLVGTVEVGTAAARIMVAAVVVVL